VFDESLDLNLASRAPRERIMEILVFLLSEIQANKAISDIDTKVLSQLGFSQTEISTAFSWLLDKLSVNGVGNDDPVIFTSPSLKRSRKETSSHRVYHEAERSIISSEARGF